MFEDNSTWLETSVIFLLGPAGGGASSLGRRFADTHFVKFLDVPAILREEAKTNSAVYAILERNFFEKRVIPWQLSFHCLRNSMRAGMTQGYKHFVVKGFPQTVTGYNVWTSQVNITASHVTYLFVGAPLPVRVERLTARGLQRDSAQKIKLRRQAYQKYTLPLISKLVDRSKMLEISSNCTPDQMWASFLGVLTSTKHMNTTLSQFYSMNFSRFTVIFNFGRPQAGKTTIGNAFAQNTRETCHISINSLLLAEAEQKHDIFSQTAGGDAGPATGGDEDIMPGMPGEDWIPDGRWLREDHYNSSKGRLADVVASRLQIGMQISNRVLAMLLRREILKKSFPNPRHPHGYRVFVVSDFPHTPSALAAWFRLFQTPEAEYLARQAEDDSKQQQQQQQQQQQKTKGRNDARSTLPTLPRCAFVHLQLTEEQALARDSSATVHQRAYNVSRKPVRAFLQDVQDRYATLAQNTTTHRVSLHTVNAAQSQKRTLFEYETEMQKCLPLLE
jgi:adenylate kinase family enzyme